MTSAPDYLPPCPACSLRSLPARRPSYYFARHTGGTMLAACCELSKDSPIISHRELSPSGLVPKSLRAEILAEEASARAELAAWWRVQRMTLQTDRANELRALFRERGEEADE